MPTPYETQPDQKQIVTLLAEEAHVPVTYVEKLYEHERTELAVGAQIKTFLHIFAIRNVREILRRSRPADLGSPSTRASSLAGWDRPC